MAIVFWWLLPIWLIVLVGGAWLYFTLNKRNQSKKHKAPIAHSERVTKLSVYQQLYHRYRLLLIVLIIVTTIGLIVSLLLSTRPVAQTLSTPEQKNRDIMLCLDVSSSMATVNKEIFQNFTKLAEGFDGQRIGLTSFNSSAVTIFPLTDDYELIKSYLARGQKGYEAFEANGNRIPDSDNSAYEDYRFIHNGTSSNFTAGASLVGDGLTACVNRMGSNGQNRSQSIILATDNEVSGKQTISLPEATEFARQKNVRVYAIDPGLSANASFGSGENQHKELEAQAERTGGAYYLSKDVQVQQIIGEVSKQEATLFSAPPEIVRNDIPAPFIIIALLVVVGILIAGWRLRL